MRIRKQYTLKIFRRILDILIRRTNKWSLTPWYHGFAWEDYRSGLDVKIVTVIFPLNVPVSIFHYFLRHVSHIIKTAGEHCDDHYGIQLILRRKKEQAKLQQIENWHSVDEVKPNDGDKVLVYFSNLSDEDEKPSQGKRNHYRSQLGHIDILSWCKVEKRWQSGGVMLFGSPSPIYWMSLPKPPINIVED